ncbi:MAG TPA: aspartyl-phosphate phosphatase Spo0E family protein [Clostridia bacterium]|nr:aspartyl-phosphate phosphatase Spo0E family protein [Clostridia bacterium]
MDLHELKTKIDILKSELNKLIEANASFDDIYSVSTELDRLIVILLKNRPRFNSSVTL